MSTPFKDAKVVGHKIKIKLIPPPKQLGKGILLRAPELMDKQINHGDEAVVVELGPTAYKTFHGEPWCKVGDHVLIVKCSGYARSFAPDETIDEEDALYRIVYDEDVLAVFEKGE